MKKSHLLILAGAVACLGMVGAVRADFFNGFETDTSGWNVFGGTNDATRVPSGTNGITSATGGFHALAAGPNNATTDDGSAATDWGGYSSVFGAGFTTKLDIYLKMSGTNDTRFDWDSAINNSSGGFRRDFVFNAGYYNDTDGTGSGPRYVISASNNATRGSSFPKNPGRDPFSITAEGWYTFVDTFYDDGGIEKDAMSIVDSLGNTLHSWTLFDAGDLTATAGGNRYGWVVFNESSSLAIDNARLITTPVPEPATLGVLGMGAGMMLVRRRRAGR